VGDKKQAIYRFRGGDAALFDAVPKEFPHICSKVEILGSNYRSARELIKFNNNIFSKDNLERFISKLGEEDEEKQFSADDTKDILAIYSDSAQQHNKELSGYVKVRSLEAKNNEERDSFMKEELITLVKSIAERRPYGDIAVLARKNDDLELFTGWLLENKIPAESDKTLNLKENGIIKEIISFLQFLDSPVDNAAFASFLLGNIYARASASAENEMEKFIFETTIGPCHFDQREKS